MESVLGAGFSIQDAKIHTTNAGYALDTFQVVNPAYEDDGPAGYRDLISLVENQAALAAASTNIQNGTQDPLEQISQSTANPRIIIVKKPTAAARFLHLETNRGLLQISTAGTTHGHSAVDSDGAYGVAATPAVGPFPGIFNTANKIETFSSDGPRRIFFTADGAAITGAGSALAGATATRETEILGELGHGLLAPMAEFWLCVGAPLNRDNLAQKLHWSETPERLGPH